MFLPFLHLLSLLLVSLSHEKSRTKVWLFFFTPKKRYSVFPVPFRFMYSEINVSAVQTAFSFLAEKFSGLAVISPDFVRAHFVITGPTIS